MFAAPAAAGHSSPVRSTVALGTSDIDITRVGLGAWAIGGGEWRGGWGRQDDDASIRAIHRAVADGINWVDTAPAYGFGRAESVVGTAIAALSPDERPLVFTKCGLVWEDGTPDFTNCMSPSSIRRECDDSLRR